MTEILARVQRYWNALAFLGWGGALIGLTISILAKAERKTNFTRYALAGQKWLQGVDLYSTTPNKGFVYSPVSAIFYLGASFLPGAWGKVFWCLISAALLLYGLHALMRHGPFTHIPVRLRGLVFLLILPLSLGNLDNAQANAFVIGLIMITVAFFASGRWTLAAIALAVAVWWKIYPLAVGLLLILLEPKKFTWRLLLAIVVLGLVPFLCQKPGYVTEQYREWITTRTGDNRLEYDIALAPLDLWFLLVRLGHLPISQTVYHVLQLAGGAAIAVYCLWGRIRQWPRERLLGGLFVFVCVWMILLGPASENHAYLLVAPAAVLAMVEGFLSRSLALRILGVGAYALLLLAILRIGFFPQEKHLLLLALQPFGALVLLAYGVKRYGFPADRSQ